jgi:hypothetical protein
VNVTNSDPDHVGIRYLENDERDPFVRPWVWVSLLFFAPFIGAITLQRYIFLAVGVPLHPNMLYSMEFRHVLLSGLKAS